MGLTSFEGDYLTDKELDILNRIALMPSDVEIHYLESIKDLEKIDIKN